jgi:quercetin dioxygenase-like cupin family protein
MKIMSSLAEHKMTLAVLGLAFGMSIAMFAVEHGERQPKLAAMVLTPEELQWSTLAAYAMPGLEQVNLVGDPALAGRYTIRLKFPKGYRIAPHTHPDSREVTVLSGTFANGYGDTFDPAKLRRLPAGSFYTEPSDVPHFIEVQDDVVLQVSGTGPSGRHFLHGPNDHDFKK